MKNIATRNACLHACFQSTFFRDRKEEVQTHLAKGFELCSGSRNQGCGGCFCRRMSSTENLGRCDRCGKFIYELLDLTYGLRTHVTLPNKNESSLLDYAIEVAVHETMSRLNLGVTNRSQLLERYGEATKITSHLLFFALSEQLMGGGTLKLDPYNPQWWWDEDFPLDLLSLFGYRDHKIYSRYEYVMMSQTE